MAAYKQLDTDKRIRLQTLLESHHSFQQIAIELDTSKSTISREVRRYRVEHNTMGFGHINRCSKRRGCDVQGLCPGMSFNCRNKKCCSCRKVNCNTVCGRYEEYHCPLTDKPPYVCNGCQKRTGCAYRKQMYFAEKADAQSRLLRSECRSGMNLTEEEIAEIDGIISPRIRLGQSLHHIFVTAKDELCISERTAYTLLHAGMLSARPVDAPRIVRMKPRRTKKQIKVDKACRVGRTYKDFQKYMEEHPDTEVLEGDTVEGVKGGKCILTLTWKSTDFQIGFLRDHNNSASVTMIVNRLHEDFGDDLFRKVFPPVWLLDNGAEFSNPSEIEKFGVRVFYCDPSSPYQKGTCENTHTHIRRILPKGTSFDSLDQGFVNCMFSHINALVRKKLNNHSAFDVFSSLYSADLDIRLKLHISRVEPADVELKQSLVRKYYDSHQPALTQEVSES